MMATTYTHWNRIELKNYFYVAIISLLFLVIRTMFQMFINKCIFYKHAHGSVVFNKFRSVKSCKQFCD